MPIAVVAVAGLVVAFAAGLARSEPTFRSIAASSVPQGVTERTVGDQHLWFVRDGEAVHAFLVKSPHVTSTRVEWCASANVFTSWPDASSFGVDGRRLSGPAPSGLFPVSVHPTDGGRQLLVGQPLAPAPASERSTLPHGAIGPCWFGRA